MYSYRSFSPQPQSQPRHRGRISMSMSGELEQPSFAEDCDDAASDVSYSSSLQDDDHYRFQLDDHVFIERKRGHQGQREMDYAQLCLDYPMTLAEQGLPPKLIRVPTDSSGSELETMSPTKKKSDKKKKKKNKSGKKTKMTRSKPFSMNDVMVSGATESDLTSTDSSNSNVSTGKEESTKSLQREWRSFTVNRDSRGLSRSESLAAPSSMPFLRASKTAPPIQRKAASSRTISTSVNQIRHARPKPTPSGTFAYPRMMVKISKLPGDFIGLTLWRNGPDLYVQGIAQSSAFENTNLLPGQKLFAINGISCANANPQKVLDFLTHSVGILALVVSREIASPVYTITKLKQPGESCGIQLRRQGEGNSNVSIAKIAPRGPFAESGLKVGMQVLFVNGYSCEGKSARECGRYLSRSLRSVVSITVAKPSEAAANRPSIKLFSLQPQHITCPMCGYQGATRTRLRQQEPSAARKVTSCFVRALGGLEMPTCFEHYCPQCAEFLGSFKGMTV